MAQPLGITLPLQLENNGYFGTNYNLLRQIKSNLTNLIRTRKGERVHQPNFGCSIHEFLFEQITPDTIQKAYESVIQDVEFWMPFLEVTHFDIKNDVQSINENTIKMIIHWRLRTNQNIGDTLILTF